MNEQWYNLKFKNGEGRTINFTDWTDWQKETIDTLNEHTNIKKVWLVNNQRKTGATYFAKLLMFFRPPCTNTFVISHNLFYSKHISKDYPIKFLISPCKTKNGEYYKASNFLTPVTLFGLEKEIKESKMVMNFLESFSSSTPSDTPSDKTSFECLYEAVVFNVKTYKKLCSYDFDFFIVNVSPKDLEKARPFIEADKDKEDVLIVNIENTLFPEIYEEE